MKNIVMLLSFFGIFYNCASPITTEDISSKKEDLEELLMTNLLYSEAFSFPSGIKLIDEQGQKIDIDSVFITPKLVIRFDYSCCEKCINTEIENIYRIYNKRCAQFIVGIVSYETPRSLSIIKQKFGIKFPIYFLPIQEGENILPSSLVKVHYPFWFMMNKDLKTKHLYIPMSELPDISRSYHKAMFSLLIDTQSFVLFHKQQIDGGEIKIDEDYQFHFSYTNTSDQPVIINDVRTTCGCTVPDWAKDPLLPGKTNTLTIKFKPNTLGFHVKKIFVYTNLDRNPIPLLIKAIVKN